MKINIQNCRIENSRGVLIPEVTWQMNDGESWLVIGPNGGGKADFLKALAGELKFVQNEDGASLPSNAPCTEAATPSEGTPAQAVPCPYEGSYPHEAPLPTPASAPGACPPHACTYATRAPLPHESPLPTSLPAPADVELVSLERAARLIQEERENDESEYVDGGVDIGRTGRLFVLQALHPQLKKGAPLPHESPLPPELAAESARLETLPAVKLCGIEKILDRGLKYMSTGEIRRTLLARALISGKKLLILSDPFAGLDAQSRTILLEFFNNIVARQNPAVILGMERWHEIPQSITHVLEFTDKKVSFCGKRTEYEKILAERQAQNQLEKQKIKEDFSTEYAKTLEESRYARLENPEKTENTEAQPKILVEMHDVNVGWDGKNVLSGLNWTLRAGEHWLVRGPNGSGKTTFLELITGDNMQVFSNDVRIFGSRRGSGESVWDIKKRLGIVSYRMHVEYRMLGGTSLRDVIVSGFRDSIGLYGAATDMEAAAAEKWLALGGFAGRGKENFGSLSYGEQRAVLILRSAVKSPEILILDEPCHGLDESYREKILHLIELICKSGTTTVLHVTHDPSEVLDCERHILELHPGETPMYQIIRTPA